MFDKIKELREMQKQAKQIQDLLAQESIVIQKGKIKIKIRGDQKIDWIEIDGEEKKDLASAFNDAIKESQKMAAKKMQGQLGNIKLPGF